MKKGIIKFIALCVTLTFILSNVNAQLPDKNQKAKMTAEQRTEKRLASMKKRLVLTDEQVAKMRPLVVAQEKIKEDQMKEVKASQEKMIDEMQKILTPEQMARFKELQEKRTEKRQEHREKKANPEK